MPLLDLSADQLLATTRAVRKRLDFSRPVEPEVIRECLELAAQAPTGSNSQNWHFVIVTDAEERKALADVYRKGWNIYRRRIESGKPLAPRHAAISDDTVARVTDSAQYLADHMHEAPVLLVPCMQGRVEGMAAAQQASAWGSILPAAWSFMLAARARGLGTSWTTLHLLFEQEAAHLLGIPYEQVTQAALIPVAYTLGTDFKPGPRIPLDSILHWNRW